MTSEVSSSSVGVFVWWDVGSCPVLEGVNLSQVSQAIKSAVRAKGMNGPVQISAVGRVLHHWKELYSAGIIINYVFKGERKDIVGALFDWLCKIPSPAHLFLITNINFATALPQFRWSDYNILLASNKAPVPGVLCAAASIVWRWDDLVTNGENSIGKCYNQPPNASWYGHYNLPLEDHPLFDAEPNSDTNSFSPPYQLVLALESRNVYVSVFWDFHSCPVPEGVTLLRVYEVIWAAIRATHIKGPIEMTALVNNELPKSIFKDLYSAGWLTTIKRGADVSEHLKSMASSCPPPTHLFVITNSNFATLEQLRMKYDHNVLLASSNVPDGVGRYASIVWRWNDLVQKEKLIGEYFNHPPWYRLPLEARREKDNKLSSSIGGGS